MLAIGMFVGISSCCDELLVLCDLLVDVFETPNEITIGQAFDVVADVINADSQDNCEIADFAAATASLLEVFLQNQSGGWDMVGSQQYPQPELARAAQENYREGVTLNQAGLYRFDWYTDAPQTVDERDENNNSKSDNSGGRLAIDREALQQTNNYASSFTLVLPDNEGTSVIQGKDIVEFH